MKLSTMILAVAVIHVALTDIGVINVTLWQSLYFMGLAVFTWPLLRIAEALEGGE